MIQNYSSTMFDTTGGNSSSSSEWDGSFPLDSYWLDYRITDYGSDNHAINGAVMWAVFVWPPTCVCGQGFGDGVYHVSIQMNEGGSVELWHGTSSTLLGDYTQTSGTCQGPSTLTIVAAGTSSPSPLTITTSSPLPDGAVGIGYSQQVSASGGGGGPYSWSITSGSLPPGLSLDTSSGTISGTPSSADTYYFTVQASDSTGTTTADFQITIGTLAVTTSSLPDGEVGIGYSQTLSVSYGSGSYTWSYTGNLPPGLSQDTSSGIISGTPSATGTYSFTVTVIDLTTSLSAQADLQITIDNPPPLVITTTSLPVGIESNSYAASLSASGGTGSGYAWTVSGLPGGLSCDGNGNITGTLSTNGNFTCLVSVSDSWTNVTSTNLSLKVYSSDYVNYLLVSSHYGSDVLRYDAETGQYLDAFVSSYSNGLNSARGMVVGPDGHLYVMSSYGGDQVLEYDLNTGAYLGSFAPFSSWDTAQAMQVGPDGAIYIGGIWTDRIARYDPVTHELNENFILDQGHMGRPVGFAFGPDGDLYVLNDTPAPGYSGSATNFWNVLKYDGTTGAFITNFVASGEGGLVQPDLPGIVFGPDGNLYVSSNDYSQSGNDQVLEYNGQTGAFITNFVAAGSGGLVRAGALSFGPDGNLYVEDYASGAIKEYSGTNGVFMGDFILAGSGGLNSAMDLLFLQDALALQTSNVGLDDALLTATSATVDWTLVNFTGTNVQNTVTFWLTSDPGTVYTNVLVSSIATNAQWSMTLTNLLAGQTYDYRVESIGWEAGYGYVASEKEGAEFTMPSWQIQILGDPYYQNLSTNSVEIVWSVQNFSTNTATHRVTLVGETESDTVTFAFIETNSVSGATNVILSVTNLIGGQIYDYMVTSFVNDANNNGSNLVTGYYATNSGTISVPALPLIQMAGTVCTLLPGNAEVAWFMVNGTTNATTNSLVIAECNQENVLQPPSFVTPDDIGLVDLSFSNLDVGSNYWFTVQSVVTGTTGYAPDMTNASSTVMFTVPQLVIDSLAATNTACTSVVVSWNVENLTGVGLTNTLFYWLDGTMGISNPFIVTNVTSSGNSAVSMTLTNLLSGQTYDYYVLSSNSIANAFAPTDYPNYSQFQTLPPCISIISNPTLSSGQSAGTATLNWTIQNDSGQSVSNVVSYTWSTATSSGSGQTDPVVTASGQTQVSVNIGNLVAGANYNFSASSTVAGYNDGDVAYSQTLGGAFAVTTNDVAVPFISISGVKTNWVTDVAASIGWHVSKADTNDFAHHYVVATTNFPPFDLQQSVIVEGFEDTNQTGAVTALLTGLTPAANYTFYVQSIIGFNSSYAATDLNGGNYYAFTTQDEDPIPPAPGDGFPLTILTLPMADPVGSTNAVIAWEFTSETNTTSHYVVFSPNTVPNPTNAFIATATPIPGIYCEVAVASLDGLPPCQTNFYFVQSVVDFGDGNSSIMPMGGFYNWFITGTNGGVGISGDVVNSASDIASLMGIDGAGASNSGSSGGNSGGGNTSGGDPGGGSTGGGNTGGTGGTGGNSGGSSGNSTQTATMNVSLSVSCAAVLDWMDAYGDYDGQCAAGTLTWSGSGGVSGSQDIYTDDIGKSSWAYPMVPSCSPKTISFDIPVTLGGTYTFSFKWIEACLPQVDGYEIGAAVGLSSSDCSLWRSEDTSKSWGESTICGYVGSDPPAGSVCIGEDMFIYPGEVIVSGPKKTWTITVNKHPDVKIQQLCFDDNVKIKKADTFADTSGDVIQAPEWKPGKAQPICYVQGYNPVITNMVLHMTQDDATMGTYTNLVLMGTASISNEKTKTTSVLTFSNSFTVDSYYDNEFDVHVNVYTTNNFPAYINYTDLDIKWTLQFDNGTTQDIGTTQNELFLIWGEPLASAPGHNDVWTDAVQIDATDITYCRLSEFCDMLAGQAPTSDANKYRIGNILAKDIMVDVNAEIGIGNSNLPTAWYMLDGKMGDCMSESVLMKLVLELLGITGAVPRAIHPCPLRYPSPYYYDEQYLIGRPPVTGDPLHGIPIAFRPFYSLGKVGDWDSWDTRLVYGSPTGMKNAFEGCCYFNNHYYMGGNHGAERIDPLAVLRFAIGDDAPNSGTYQFYLSPPYTRIPAPKRRE